MTRAKAVVKDTQEFSSTSPETNVRDELTLAIQMERNNFEVKSSEEKKDDLTFDATVTYIDTDEEPPEEQGQEILWIENAADASTPKQKSGKTRKKLPKSQKIAQIIADGSNSHIILLPEPNVEVAPREKLEICVNTKDNVVDSESRLRIAAEKVATAKQLLEQAFNEKSMDMSKELAEKAFSLALEARGLVEIPSNTSDELTTVLNDASTKGKAEVAKVQELKHQSKTCSLRSEEEHHASRARSMLDFILPENNVTTPKVSVERYRLLSHSVLETVNSSDAIVKDVTRRKDFDVLSMSSLNEILDGPEEETASPVQATNRTLEAEETKLIRTKTMCATGNHDNATMNTKEKQADTNSELIATEGEIDGRNDIMNDDEPKNSRKSGLFKGLFVSKKMPREQKGKSRKLTTKTITASILSENITSGLDQDEYDGIDPNDELHAKVAAIDQKVRKNLEKAIMKDGTECVTSLENVKIHYVPDSDQILEATENITPERLAQHRRTVESARPSFVAASKGHSHSHLLASSSWDSLALNEDRRTLSGKYSTTSKNQKQKHKQKKSKSPQKGGSKCGVVLDNGSKTPTQSSRTEFSTKAKARSNSSSVSPTAENYCDRYAVIPEEDRYNTIEPADSFEAFLKKGEPKDLIILPASDTISTLGIGSYGDKSPPSRKELSHADKYHLEPEAALPSQGRDKYQASVVETVPQGGLRIVGTAEMSRETFNRTAASARRSPSREICKPKHEKAVKKLKRKSLAGIFGFNRANPSSNSQQRHSKHMVSSMLPRSEPSTKVNVLQSTNTEKVTMYAAPSVKIHVVPNLQNEKEFSPKLDSDNQTKNVQTTDDFTTSHFSGSIPPFPSKTKQISLTYSESINEFENGLDKPTETDSTLSLCDNDLGPETSNDGGQKNRSEVDSVLNHDNTEEDPLVAHLKQQIVRQPRRGIDPSSAKVSSRGSRLDP